MTTRRRRALLLACTSVAAGLPVAGCGGEDDFVRKPRPPITLQLTGVITEEDISIQPNNVGAGPIILNVSNQTKEPHTVTLEGEGIAPEQVGPVKPLDTATIQKELKPGTYEVRAGSSAASARRIQPGMLTIGQPRDNSSDDLLLP